MHIETGGDRFMVRSASGRGFQDEAVSRFYRWEDDFVDDILSAISQQMMGLGLSSYSSHGLLQGFGKPGMIFIMMKLKRAEQCEYAEATNVPRGQKNDSSRYTASRVSCEC
ncbi:MAG: hypothetical protein K9N21_00185 [Deltaproteobacteria bacterium]|nr:hypothetical protein [Deltaproteobacteria bacterium]